MPADPVLTTTATTAVVVLTKDTIQKLLGPTSELLGQRMRDAVERTEKNVGRILSAAVAKLGNRINTEGAVHPRVLKEVLQEGSFVEDELMAEYFGGVLASSRGPVSRDDRGASMIKVLAQMTAYEVRSHYLFYSAIKRLHRDRPMNLGEVNHRLMLAVFMSYDCYRAGMSFTAEEDFDQLVTHAIYGLGEKQLIENFAFGNKEDVKNDGAPRAFADGIKFSPSVRGAELFLWANGMGSVNPRMLVRGDVVIPEQSKVLPETGFCTAWTSNSDKATG